MPFFGRPAANTACRGPIEVGARRKTALQENGPGASVTAGRPGPLSLEGSLDAGLALWTQPAAAIIGVRRAVGLTGPCPAC
ncbi:hypothetical protein KPB2_5549 [Klebsiella pneumoniae Kb677]|nr:hypothetical protein KPB2_5549 [Klebsiella pneumoniae Kb677]